MAFLTKCCCCELRIGVIIIGIIGIVLGLGNIFKSINDLRSYPAARDYVRDHPYDTEKYGITLEFFDALEGFVITGIVINAIAVITDILIIIPAGFQNREQGRKYRSFLLAWIVWAVVGMLYCISFAIWAFVVFKVFIAGFIVSIISIIIIIVTIALMLVVIAFYQQLGEPMPVAVVQPIQGYVPQATVYPPGYGYPQQNMAMERPPEYSEKTAQP